MPRSVPPAGVQRGDRPAGNGSWYVDWTEPPRAAVSAAGWSTEGRPPGWKWQLVCRLDRAAPCRGQCRRLEDRGETARLEMAAGMWTGQVEADGDRWPLTGRSVQLSTAGLLLRISIVDVENSFEFSLRRWQWWLNLPTAVSQDNIFVWLSE